MAHNPWSLEFEDSSARVDDPDGLLAVLSYPISEAGVFETPRSTDRARLMAVLPALLDSLQLLLSALANSKSNETDQVRAAMQQGTMATLLSSA